MDPVELTKRLISFQTTAANPAALKRCADFLADFFQGTDLKVDRFEQNNKPSLVITASGQKDPKLFLNGHFDVVPGEPDQFKPEVKSSRLYGRGAYDMKGAVAVMACLMRDLAKVDSPSLKKVGLMLVGDEEVGGFDGSKYLLELGYKSQCLIVGEPTNFAIGIQAKGVLWLNLKTTGQSAHGAYPWQGENAISKMVQALDRVTEAFPVPDGEVWQTLLNIGKIEGGKAPNIVPDHCQATLDIRFVPEDDPADLINKVKNIVGKDVELEVVMKEPAVTVDPNNPYSLGLKEAVGKVTGQEGVFVSKHGAADTRFFSALAIPAFEFGPVGNGHHSDQEWLDLKSLEKFSKMLEHFIKSLS